ncbi:MAG: Ig-like domain-containing protein [Anaerolineales bacterium]
MVNKNIKLYVAFILAVLLGMSSFVVAYSQATLNLQIDKIQDEKYPALEVYVSVSNESNAPVSNLDKDKFSLVEAGAPVPAFDVSPVYEKGLAVAVAIDISESMGFGKPVSALAASVAQAKDLISTLGNDDQIAVVAFSDKVSVAQELTGDKSKALAALDGLKAGKDASLYNAIADSASLFNNFSGRRAVILFTDSADAGYGGYSLAEALNIAQQKKVAFFPIYWNAASKQEMTKLASLTNGKDFGLGVGVKQPGDQDFLAATTEIKNQLHALREQYLIRYTSALPASGNESELVVKVDYQGAHAEQALKFTARAGNLTVDLKNLTDGQSVAGNVEIVPDVTAPGMISKLEIFVDDKSVGAVSGQPFKYIWDTTKSALGNHALKVVVTDSVGNTGSKTLNLNVQVPVTVTIASPAADAVIDQPVSIEVNVASAKQISYIEIILDKQVLQRIDAPASYPVKYEFDPGSTPPGKHQLTVKAYDPDGFSGESDISLNLAPGGGGSGAWLAILAVLALAGILIPVALRSRRRKGSGSGLGASAGAGAATLSEIEGANPGQTWSLDRDEIRLGRKATENDIPLKGTGASRYHAVIRRSGSQFVLFVLNPANPVVVNQMAVTGQKVLQPGDVLQAGESTFRFEA